MLYCSASAFLQGRGIRAWGPWGARRTGLGWPPAGEPASLAGLELLAVAAAAPEGRAEGEETGGEEDESAPAPSTRRGAGEKTCKMVDKFGLNGDASTTTTTTDPMSALGSFLNHFCETA